MQQIFGHTVTIGRTSVPTRLVAERHILEDLGWLPSPADYVKEMELSPWMSGEQRKEFPLSVLLGDMDESKAQDLVGVADQGRH